MRGDGLPGAGTSAGAASLEDFLSTLPALGSPATPASPEGPFLSFLVTTTGRTPEGLDETLLSLTAQSDTDFEVLVLADADAVDEVRALLAEHPPTLRERTVVVPASGSLADVVNAGLAEARGAYVTLADDLTWFGHWVETARAAVERSPGRCVRGIVLAQQVTTVHVGGSPGTRATSSPTGAGAAPFSLAQHVVRPLAPACGVAIPRTVITDLGVVLDASYGTAAVRRHLVRAVELAGVIDTGEVVALQRRHEDVADETDDDLALLVEAIDAHPWLSPLGAASAAIAATVVDSDALARAEQALAHHTELVAMKDTHIANLEHMLRERDAELQRTHEKLAKRTEQVERLRAKRAQPAQRPESAGSADGGVRAAQAKEADGADGADEASGRRRWFKGQS